MKTYDEALQVFYRPSTKNQEQRFAEIADEIGRRQGLVDEIQHNEISTQLVLKLAEVGVAGGRDAFHIMMSALLMGVLIGIEMEKADGIREN